MNWLKVCKTKQINKILLVLSKLTRPPAENVVSKFLLDATLLFDINEFHSCFYGSSSIGN